MTTLTLSILHDIQDNEFNPLSLLNYELSIQFSLNGFSFCVFDVAQAKHMVFKSYAFFGADAQGFKQMMHEIQAKNPYLSSSFNKVRCIYQGVESTLIPLPLYQEDNKETYLKAFFHVATEDVILEDEIKPINAKNIFTVPLYIYDYVESTYPKQELKHYKTPLITNILLNNRITKKENRVYVQMQDKQFDIFVVNGNKLLLSNTFSFVTPTDFVYYVLFVYEQLQLNPLITELVLLGMMSSAQEEYIWIKNYVSQVSLLQKSDSLHRGEVFSALAEQSYYNLFHLNLCE